MKAICKREFFSYFQSFIGSLFIGAILFLTGIYVTVYNLLSGIPYISYALSGVLFIFIISVPVLTMRVLAEERRQKTDQMLLTAPVTVGKIVAGKFFALAAVFSIAILVICIYPPILSMFGAVSMAESYAAILAFYLYGLTAIAIGIFVSSLTESQVISAVITFAILFLGYMMGGITNMISTTGNLLTKLLDWFNLSSRFDSLIQGTFDVTAVVYFLSLIFLFLFLTAQMIQKRRYSVSAKSLRMGAYSFVTVLAAGAAVILLNVLMKEIPTAYTTFDITSDQLYSLSEESRTLVKGLTEDVTLYVIANENNQDTTLKQTLNQYDGLSDRLTVTYIDPVVNPKFFTQYTDGDVTRNSLIAVSGKRSKVIDYSTIYESTVDYSTYSSTVTGYDGEGQITSAISYVINEDMPKLYVIEGHGELPLETAFNDTIAKANIDYETINLLQYDAIPEDAEGIVINAPTTDFSSDDKNKVLNYLNTGGNALIVTTWTETDMTNFKEILSYYDVAVADGVVIETDENAYYQSPYYLLPTIGYDEITSAVSDSYIFAPFAQGLLLPEEPEESVSHTALLTTQASSFARASVTETQDYEKQEGDIDGPFTLGVKAVKALEGTESTALIYSSESLFTASADTMVSGNNMKLFAASLGALAEETEGTAIPVKSYQMTYLTVPQSAILLYRTIFMIVIPAVIILGGFIIWVKRRRA